MLHERNLEQPQRIGFLLVPNFSMMCLLSAVEPLRVANRFAGGDAYRWQFISATGGPIQASNGMAIMTEAGIDDVADVPVVAVVASEDPLRNADPRIYPWLRKLHRQGRDLGAFDTAPYLLAEAGLLSGRHVTLHWEVLDAFREAYPDVDARDALFDVDGSIFTCSGGTAALDLMLDLISQHHSHELAVSVSEQFMHHEVRQADVTQRMPADRRAGTHNRTLVRAVAVMEQNIEAPVSLAEVAAACELTKRQLDRLFATHMGKPPLRHYLDIRLERARHLLSQTDMPVSEIGFACGFGSSAYFSRAYRRRYGRPPRAERSQAA
ncbi:transcriptional regulator, AraC family with amidase-like domain [Limimonas halophila]|uniref:Transcriptional regulator, AraC family with amidase-like domain n=1 Tax=Limimonas halophila TaxID=1082479 RepID=A0A1G7Q3E5_9PROT|nr:GlxA family transcriptional regulator [Limimonas halophila]SDF92985.1 transcriptional regulator, AraC family with amidase-like domain [Limimonas halophila]